MISWKLAIGRPRSRGWKNFGRSWTRGGGLENWTIFMDVICISSLTLIQYFCLHGILPFSKSYTETESTWPTAKCRRRKSFDTWYYIVICATLCVRFSSKSKATNVFPKHSEIQSKWSINSSKEEIVLSRDSKELFVRRFLTKIETTWRCEIKKQTIQKQPPELFYEKVALKNFLISTRNTYAEVFF